VKKLILKYCIAAFVLLMFNACLDNKNPDVEYSNNPTFSRLVFTNNDSLKNAKFTLEFDSMTINGITYDTIIVNLDSLPYRSNISKVISTFYWASTSKTCIYYHYQDTLKQNVIDTVYLQGGGKDTIDFTRTVIVENTSSDGKVTRAYPIKVNVHQVEPELYVWQEIKDEVFKEPINFQQVICFKDTFFYYASYLAPNDANYSFLSTSTNGIDWCPESTAGLSELMYWGIIGMRGKIIEFKNKLYVVNLSKLCCSNDGYNWAKLKTTYNSLDFQSLLFALNDSLWAIIKSEGCWERDPPECYTSYYFASSSNGIDWTVKDEIPTNFPISDFASLSFYSATKKPKALIVGGISKKGEILKNVWSTENGAYWVDFSKEKNNRILPHTNGSLIKYNDRIFLFGGKGVSDKVDTPILESLNDGLSWRIPDSTYNVLRQIKEIIKDSIVYESYTPRPAPSAFYVPTPNSAGTTDHFIYLIGGENYSDVWRGKLNKLSFKR